MARDELTTSGASEELSSLVGHAAPPEQQRERLQSKLRLQASRIFLLACGPVFLPVAGLLWVTRQAKEWQGGWVPPALALLIAVLALLRLVVLARAPRRQESRAATLAMLALVLALPVVVSVARDLGLWSLCLPLMSLVIAFATGLHGLGAGLLLTGLAGVALLGLGLAEGLGWVTHPMGTSDLWLRGFIQAAMLGSGLVAGIGLLKMVKRSLAEADERTARFRGLLGMAVDWYWAVSYTHLTLPTKRIV